VGQRQNGWLAKKKREEKKATQEFVEIFIDRFLTYNVIYFE